MPKLIQVCSGQSVHLIPLVLVAFHPVPNAIASHIGSMPHLGNNPVFVLHIDVVFERIEEVPVHELSHFPLLGRCFLGFLCFTCNCPRLHLSHFPVDKDLLTVCAPFDVVHPNRQRILLQICFWGLFPASKKIQGQLIQPISDFIAAVAVLDCFPRFGSPFFSVPISK